MGTVVEKLCPIGTFSAFGQLKSVVDCQPCTPGHYCDRMGLNATSGNCSAGYYCLGNATVSTPTDERTGIIVHKLLKVE